MIPIKTEKEIEILRESGAILSRVLNMLADRVGVGVSTKDLDDLAEDEIKKAGGFPIFKGYEGFPTAICTSFNDEVVHGSARPERIVCDGDILSIDLGVRYPAKKGMITDMATTVMIGKQSAASKKLVEVTKKSLEIAIDTLGPGVPLGDVGAAIQDYVEKNGFSVVRDLVGHGVGKKLHEEPQVPNYGKKGTGPIIQPGMVLAIEPMVAAGSAGIIYDNKTRAYRTEDGSMSAHFEHTLLVTEKGVDILTK